MTPKRVVLVTDPLCSWCWGMADEFQLARKRLAERVDFDLMLGGINVHGTQPIGDYGRRFLMKLWREVAETTGQTFGFKLPEDEYVHNSVAPCLLLEAVRQATDSVPFELLHELQWRFFVTGEDITDLDFLSEQAARHGVDNFKAGMRDEVLKEKLRFQFDNAGAFGTNALPSLLIEQQGTLRLLAGGYVDAGMMETLIGE